MPHSFRIRGQAGSRATSSMFPVQFLTILLAGRGYSGGRRLYSIITALLKTVGLLAWPHGKGVFFRLEFFFFFYPFRVFFFLFFFPLFFFKAVKGGGGCVVCVHLT